MDDHITHYVGDSCPPDGHRTAPYAAAVLNALEHVTTADQEDKP